MPTALSEEIFHESIGDAVQKVFVTMLRKNATPVDGQVPVPAAETWIRPEDLAGAVAIGSVGFAGDFCGLVFLYLSEKLALGSAQAMLGMSADEIASAGREVVSDVIGELTNMTVGVFKNRIQDMGYPCKLTIPTVVWGHNVTIQPTRGAIRRTYVFQVENQSVVLDLIVKED